MNTSKFKKMCPHGCTWIHIEHTYTHAQTNTDNFDLFTPPSISFQKKIKKSTSYCTFRDDDGSFYYHCWRNKVVIAFGTLSSFLMNITFVLHRYCE